MEIFDFSQKTTKELEERLDYLFSIAVEKNKERIKSSKNLGKLPRNRRIRSCKARTRGNI